MKRSFANFDRLAGFSIGFYGVWITHIGSQMKFFDRLSGSPMTVDELITTSGLFPPAVRIWCSAACSYGLINKKKGKLQLNKHIKSMLLDKKSPDYLGGQFSYLALKSLNYAAFEHLFKSGKTLKMTSSDLIAIEHATQWDHYALLAAVRRRRRIHKMLSDGCNLLDVGCGTGGMLTKMLESYPKSTFVGIDPSQEAVAMARTLAKGKPITIMRQNGESMVFVNEFEIVYLGESLYAARDKVKVMSNCWRALKKHGTIAILEGLLPELKCDITASLLIMGMQLDFALHGHEFMTKKEIGMLLKGRFSKIRFQDLGGSVCLVTAIK